MSRLTEREINLIQAVQNARRQTLTTPVDILVTARFMQSTVFARYLRSGLGAVARVTGLGAVARMVNEILVAPLKAGLRRHETVAVLSRLDDHMLRDIGLDRTRVQDLATGLTESNGGEEQRGIFARLRYRYQRRVSIKTLEALDDRTLEDIGIPRGDIPGAVDRALGQKSGRASKVAVINLVAGKPTLFLRPSPLQARAA